MMRIIEIIIESSNLLYHKTEAIRLNRIVTSGYIGVSSPKITNPDWDYGDYGSVSLTRDPDWYHFNDEANAVVITVDGDALRKLSNVANFAWQSNLPGVGPAEKEQEERIGQNIPFTNQFIKQVVVHYNERDIKKVTIQKLRSLNIPIQFVE